MVWELVDRNERIPGRVCVGQAWDALRHVVGLWDSNNIVAPMLSGEGDDPLPIDGAFGKPHILSNASVSLMAAVCAEMPDEPTDARWNDLKGIEVHGDYFIDEERPSGSRELDELLAEYEVPSESIDELDRVWRKVRVLVEDAARRGDAILTMLT